MTFTEFPAKFGKYILLDRLAAGGMAEVFRAKVTGVEGFERLVAIKCMLPSMVTDEHFTGMFVDEARLAAQVGHTNVVQIYELGRERERLYIAMELIAGRDLRHILKTAEQKNVSLPPQFAAYVAAKTAEGLDFAHRKLGADGEPLGLVHRDVSPQNILVSYDGVVKVVDFGIAKASTEARGTQTQVGILKGKFAYMAPEQVAGQSLDRRADIFALGSVLYEMLCNRRLFRGDSDLTVLEHVREAILPDFTIDLPQPAQRLVPVLHRALALGLDDRFAWASEMAEALEPLLIEGQSIFGAKRAAALMRELFADEVAQLAQDLKRFADVSLRDVHNAGETTDVTKAPTAGGHMVFESTFAASSTGRSLRDDGGRVDVTGEMRAPPALRMSTQPGIRPSAYGVDDRAPRTTARRDLPMTQSSRPKRVELPKKQTPYLATEARKAAGQRPPAFVPPPEGEVEHSNTQVVSRAANSRQLLKRLRTYVGLAAAVSAVLIAILSFSAKSPWQMAAEDSRANDSHPLAWAASAWNQLRSSSLVDRYLFGGTRAEVTAKEQALSHMTLPVGAAGQAADEEGESGADAAADGTGEPEGFLRIGVTGANKARVQIDGRDMGYAPLPPVQLKAGPHKVRVTRISPSGARHTREVKVDISAGDSQETPAAVEVNF